jgi:hypothetical protein
LDKFTNYRVSGAMSALLDHSEDIYRGAFYIIDNAGQCPSGVNESDFQHSTIEAHLRRHTYYQLTDKGNIRVDVETMHAFIRGLYSYEQLSDAVTKSAHGCQSSEDLADSFFHLGTDKLSPQTLVSYGYEKSTFREEDLPKYAPPSLPKRSGVNAQHQHIRRSFWVIIQDIEATKAQRDHAAYKYRDRVSRFNALAALIRDFSLKYSSRKGTLKSCTSEQLCKTFLDTWKSQKNGGATNASSPWASSSKDWKPSYLESIEQSCAKLTLGESLRSYNPDQAVSLSTDLVREAKDSMIADPKRAVGEAAADGIELDVDVIEVYDDKLSSRAGRVDDIADGLQRVRSLTSAPTATVKPVSTSPLGRSTRATLEAARRMRSDAQRAATCSDSLDEVSEALSSLSGSDSETSRATLIDHKRKRVISDTYSRGKRQNAMNDPPSMTATRTPPIDGQDRTDVASWVAHRLGSDVAGDKPVNAYNSCGAQPPLLHRPRETTCHRQISERPVLTALNLSKLESELKDIYRKMSNASLQLLDGVGDVGEETMPLDTDPPSSTSELHIRCWGDEWPRIRAKLKHSKLFSVPDVAMSLNSAYLFDKILRRPVQKIQVTLDPEADFASGSIGDGKIELLSESLECD